MHAHVQYNLPSLPPSLPHSLTPSLPPSLPPQLSYHFAYTLLRRLLTNPAIATATDAIGETVLATLVHNPRCLAALTEHRKRAESESRGAGIERKAPGELLQLVYIIIYIYHIILEFNFPSLNANSQKFVHVYMQK